MRSNPADNLPCHFVSAFGAGFVTTVIASPVDVVKTRYMNSPPGQYKSAINCAWTMLTKEGPTAFYKGWAPPPACCLVEVSNDDIILVCFFLPPLHRFVPSFLRLGSWNVVMFVSFEQIKRAMMVTKKRIEDRNWDSRSKCLIQELEIVGRESLGSETPQMQSVSFLLHSFVLFCFFWSHDGKEETPSLKRNLDNC